MQPDDLPAIGRIECAAFGVGATRARTSAFLEFAYRNNPSGCFVAFSPNRLCGFVFTQITGEAGWIGLLAVHPECQNQKIGATLLNEAIAHLRAKSVITAIQLPSDAHVSVRMCLNAGLQPVEPQIVLSSSVKIAAHCSGELTRPRIDWQDVFGVLAMGELMEKAGLARVIALDVEGCAVGAVVVETQPRRQGLRIESGDTECGARESGRPVPSGRHYTSCLVSFGSVMRSLSAQPLRVALASAARLAAETGVETIYVALNGFYHRELALLCGDGWSVRRITQRLVHARTVSRYKQLLALPQVEFSNWSL